ncbi:MAG TPA: PrsW family intramembrane metalloprotease [Candidatus Moranbacteria bacterium]|nr:PrsW family intramembrane metalloprotease [Candidatus Moranbacteria bacterium]
MELIILLAVYLILVFFPIAIWLMVFLFLDRKEPEPGKMIVKTIFFSAIAVLVAMSLENLVDKLFFSVEELSFIKEGVFIDPVFLQKFILTFFMAGVLEEIIKYFFLRIVIFKNKHCNQLADGIIYGVILALGFALIENTGYFLSNFPGALTSPDLFLALIFRGLVTTLLHTVATGIMGLFMAKEKLLKKNKFLAEKGLLLAALAHGLFNVLVFSPYGTISTTVLVFSLMGYLIYKLTDKQSQEIHD